jgi:4-diphosphocytidyl-2-C-methyl-D-erythritol kinase
MKIKSYAKLNLTLEVVGKNYNGYHKILGIFQNINLFDEITIKESKNDLVNIDNKNILQSNNIAYKALKLLKNEMQIKNSFSVGIKKNIPISSGLGGGSSNAAAVIYGLNKMLDLNLSINEMISLSQKIGSDIAFFFTGGTCLVSGFGEKIEKLNNILIDNFNLFYIPINLKNKTRHMYNLINENNFTDGKKSQEVKKLILNSQKLSPGNFYNVFFEVAKENFSKLKIYSDEMYNNFNNCSLSGAGMTLFSVSNKNFDSNKYKQFSPIDTGIEIVS